MLLLISVAVYAPIGLLLYLGSLNPANIFLALLYPIVMFISGIVACFQVIFVCLTLKIFRWWGILALVVLIPYFILCASGGNDLVASIEIMLRFLLSWIAY